MLCLPAQRPKASFDIVLFALELLAHFIEGPLASFIMKSVKGHLGVGQMLFYSLLIGGTDVEGHLGVQF